jgi:hypothetical protein
MEKNKNAPILGAKNATVVIKRVTIELIKKNALPLRGEADSSTNTA